LHLFLPLSKFDIKVIKSKIKAKIKGVLAGHKMITTCLPMIRQFFDTMIVATIDNE